MVGTAADEARRRHTCTERWKVNATYNPNDDADRDSREPNERVPAIRRHLDAVTATLTTAQRELDRLNEQIAGMEAKKQHARLGEFGRLDHHDLGSLRMERPRLETAVRKAEAECASVQQELREWEPFIVADLDAMGKYRLREGAPGKLWIHDGDGDYRRAQPGEIFELTARQGLRAFRDQVEPVEAAAAAS